MREWVKFKTDRQFNIFIVSVLSFHLTFRYLNWTGQYAWLLLIPILFSIYNLLMFIIIGIRKSIWDFKYLLIALLYFIFPLKIGFIRYNILFPVILVAISVYILRHNIFKIPKLKNRLIFLMILNIFIVVTPDLLIFKYLNTKDYHVWGSNLEWDDFKGEEPNNIGEMDARIESNFYFKFNRVYNFPQYISLSLMEKKGSWVRPKYNNYEGNLLKHEQLHFDITEWTRREFHDSLSNCIKLDYTKAKAIFYYFNKLETTRQLEYDSVSKHGVDFNGQIKWNKKVKQSLE